MQVKTECRKREELMTEAQIKEQFPEATEEQITAILNISGNELKEAKKKNIDPKVLKKLQEDSAAYEKLKEADLTDAEKIQKALDDAKTAETEFHKKSNRLDAEKILVAAGLTEKEYENLIASIVTDDVETTKTNANNLATLIKGQKDIAIQKTKEELMDGTPTPGGEPGGGQGGDEKTEDVKMAESIASSFSSGSESAKNVFDNY